MSDSAQARPHLLQVDELSIDGGMSREIRTPILREVSFDLKKGEVLGIVGESGAGKSTLGLSALGIVRGDCAVTGGSVDFDGVSLFDVSPAQLRSLRGGRTTYVAQSASASFNPAHRLMSQIIERSLVDRTSSPKEVKAKAVDLFRQLQLPNPETFGDRFPHQVSGGQLQRAMLAMALISEPDLVIFDEPTTALDVTTQIEVLSCVKELVEQRDMAAIYVTHDLALVAQISHRILVLRDGRVIEHSTTRKMLSSPEDPYTRSLWSVRQLDKDVNAPSPHLLTIKNVSARYGKVEALQNISVDIPRGHTVALVGESGSGKSTLAKVIAGILPPVSGSLKFDNCELPHRFKDRSPDLLRRIQLIHQSPDTSLNPVATIRKTLSRPVKMYDRLSGRALRERVDELLVSVGLPIEFGGRRPGELSGGQKQRVAIARALAARPDLILCDEVTSALDQIVQREIIELLLSLQKTFELSYVFITHDLATVKAIADEVVVMQKGRIVEQGTKDQVLSPPFKPYTDLLLSSVPEMDPDWLQSVSNRRAAIAGA